MGLHLLQVLGEATRVVSDPRRLLRPRIRLCRTPLGKGAQANKAIVRDVMNWRTEVGLFGRLRLNSDGEKPSLP
eukprot:5421898-Heterocapsa_arctica.AAC.1